MATLELMEIEDRVLGYLDSMQVAISESTTNEQLCLWLDVLVMRMKARIAF